MSQPISEVDEFLDSLNLPNFSFEWNDETKQPVEVDPRVQAEKRLNALLHKAEVRGRINELDHIDDPVNVNVYFEGLVPVSERKAALKASLNKTGDTE